MILEPLLLHRDRIHLELETVLNKCHKNLNIFIKLKGTLHKCAWRPSVTLNPTMSMKTVNDHVSYEAKLNMPINDQNRIIPI